MTIRKRLAGLVPAVTLRGRFTVKPVGAPTQALSRVRARLVAALRSDVAPPSYIEETAGGIYYRRGHLPVGPRHSRIGAFDPGTIRLAVTGSDIAVSYQVQARDGRWVVFTLLVALFFTFQTGSVLSGTGWTLVFLAFSASYGALQLWRFRNWLKSEATEAAAKVAPDECADEAEA